MSQPTKRKLRNPIHNPVDWAKSPLINFIENYEDEEKQEELPINNFMFCVTHDFKDLQMLSDEDESGEEIERVSLTDPSGLTKVLLCSDYWKKKYREVDFTGTTCEQAIKKILTFYKHRTLRSGIRDHIFFEGFYMINGMYTIALGS